MSEDTEVLGGLRARSNEIKARFSRQPVRTAPMSVHITDYNCGT